MIDSRFQDALLSPSAHSDIPPQARIFEPLLGSWGLRVRWYDDRGELERVAEGEWHFARTLEGRAIQDVWIVPPRGQRGRDDYEYGTSVRFYDAALDAWRSTWIGPMRGALLTFIARRHDDRIRLETTADIAPARRWTFHDIAAASFGWSNEERHGDDWRLVQTFEAVRARPGKVDQSDPSKSSA